MVAKIVVLAMCVVAAVCQSGPQAAQFPAGVNPQACPNYPYCDNAALASYSAAPAPYAAPNYAAYGHQSGGVSGAAVIPAGVDPRSCPNYPYCGPTPAQAPPASQYNSYAAPSGYNSYAPPAPAYNAYSAPAPAADQGGAQFPAGVNPQSCPNYPYCH